MSSVVPSVEGAACARAARIPFALALHRARRAAEPGMLPARAAAPDHRPLPDGAGGVTPPHEEILRGAAVPSPLLARATELAAAAPGAPAVRLDVSHRLSVRIAGGEAGVALILEVPPLRAGPTEAALPRLVETLRARGLAVREASVRTGRAGRRAR